MFHSLLLLLAGALPLQPADSSPYPSTPRAQEASLALPTGAPRFISTPPLEIRCPPPDLCVVTFDPTEVIQDIVLASPDRWTTSSINSGATNHLVIMATTPDSPDSAMLVTTNHRLVRAKLHRQGPATPQVSLTAPDELLVLRNPGGHSISNPEPLKLAASNLHFSYSSSRNRLAPQTIFDDGVRTLLVWNTRPREAFVVLAIEDGQPSLLNSRLLDDGKTLVIDGVHPHLRLQQGKATIDIRRKGL